MNKFFGSLRRSMVEKRERRSSVMINRAPVLTLWAAVVAEVLGFDYDEALTLGRAVAGLNAYSKGVALGLFQPTPKAVREQRQKLPRDEVVTVDLLHRAVPARHTDEGLRALSNDRPISPESVKRYLESKFGDALNEVYDAMKEFAKSLAPSELAEKPTLSMRSFVLRFLRGRRAGERQANFIWKVFGRDGGRQGVIEK
jgi:hypothetical protein